CVARMAATVAALASTRGQTAVSSVTVAPSSTACHWASVIVVGRRRISVILAPSQRIAIALSSRQHGDMASIRVGGGGWVYAPWRDNFYPKGLAQTKELHYASRHLSAIEINGTFYGAQKPSSFRKWYEETPEDFVFSVKGTRYATHRRALAESKDSVDRFL